MSAAGDLRDRVCRAMWDEMNGWMSTFAQAAYAIPKALLDGRLTEEQITTYPGDGSYPEDLSRVIAEAAGLRYCDEGPQYNDSGWRIDVDPEDIGIGVEALRAIPAADASRMEDPDCTVWQLYAESLDEHGLSIEQVRDVMRGLSLRDAAQLLLDAHTAHP